MHLEFLLQPARAPARAASFCRVPGFCLYDEIEMGVNGAAGFNANSNDANDGGLAASSSWTLLDLAVLTAKAKQTDARANLNIFEDEYDQRNQLEN